MSNDINNDSRDDLLEINRKQRKELFDEVLRLEAQNDRLRHALRSAAMVFQSYAEHHAKKAERLEGLVAGDHEEAHRKAEKNAELARVCRKEAEHEQAHPLKTDELLVRDLCDEIRRIRVENVPALMKHPGVEKEARARDLACLFVREALAARGYARILGDRDDLAAQAQREQYRADAAEQMVCELRAAMHAAGALADEPVADILDAALSRTEAVAVRWVPVEVFKRHREALLRDMDRVGADVVKARAERDAAIAEAVRESRVSEVRTQRVMLERDAAIACNEAMREPMRRLRAVVDMPAQGEGIVVDAVIARLAAAERARDMALQDRDSAVATAAEIEEELGALKEAIAQHLPTYVNENDEDDHCDPVETVENAGRDLDAASDRATMLERARDEVGIQLAAAQAEIARMRPVVDAATLACHAYFVSDPEDAYTGYMQHLEAELAKLRTVPGDALAPVER